jgi:hypothetical protein
MKQFIHLVASLAGMVSADHPALPPNDGKFYFANFNSEQQYEGLAYFTTLQVGHAGASEDPDRVECKADDFCPAQSIWLGFTTQEFPFAIITD